MSKAMYLHHHISHPVIPPSGKKSVGNWISGRPTVVSSWICLRYSQTLEHSLFYFALGSTVRSQDILWCFSAWHLVLSLMQCILHYLLTDCDTTNAFVEAQRHRGDTLFLRLTTCTAVSGNFSSSRSISTTKLYNSWSSNRQEITRNPSLSPNFAIRVSRRCLTDPALRFPLGHRNRMSVSPLVI